MRCFKVRRSVPEGNYRNERVLVVKIESDLTEILYYEAGIGDAL